MHTETAQRIYGTEPCDHDAKLKCPHRQVGKTGIFAKVYGSGVSAFADTVGLPIQDASALYYAIDEIYPGLSKMMSQVTRASQQRARECGGSGYVTLIDGRRLRVPADKSYTATNYLIQGSCATVLKRALVDLDFAGFGEYMVLPIHDEIIFDMPAGMIEDALPQITKIMTRDDFRAPLTVSASVVQRWGEAYA